MTSKGFTRYVLPLVVFPALTAVAVKVIFGRLQTGMSDGLKVQCGLPDSPYRIPFTGNPRLDGKLCGIVATFHNLLEDPLSLQFLVYGLGTGTIAFFVPVLEASRSRKFFLLAFPVIWLLLAQLATIGFIMTLWAPIFILSGSHLPKRNKADTRITRVRAESLIFSLIEGYFVPTLGMVYLKDPQVTAIWQIFPVILSVAAFVHLGIRHFSKVEGSGYPFVQVLLVGIFVLSSSIHFATVFPILADTNALGSLLIPYLTPLPAPSPTSALVLDFLKWDIVVAFSTLGVATLWFASSLTQFIGLILWYAFAIPMTGPGAAITGVFLWREAKLQK
ncbi:hypothetical protein FA13DRAFT_1787468 [Coprinellus micaceus]|uniref:Uncharacterized protein n=1 Tax=Coprinellus micaceus TaxID=71717 RepID=A0A4Y7TP86_COPMI|nr:hypothetical protein FA13DRAFT_1787468 [Coprinellus micaceus]